MSDCEHCGRELPHVTGHNPNAALYVTCSGCGQPHAWTLGGLVSTERVSLLMSHPFNPAPVEPRVADLEQRVDQLEHVMERDGQRGDKTIESAQELAQEDERDAIARWLRGSDTAAATGGLITVNALLERLAGLIERG